MCLSIVTCPANSLPGKAIKQEAPIDEKMEDANVDPSSIFDKAKADGEVNQEEI